MAKKETGEDILRTILEKGGMNPISSSSIQKFHYIHMSLVELRGLEYKSFFFKLFIKLHELIELNNENIL
jgi:hypothetical protein